jgi:hypothetical protein
MTTLFTLGAPIGLWLHAIRTAQKERFHEVEIVREWKPTPSTWLLYPPAPMEVLVPWDPEKYDYMLG